MNAEAVKRRPPTHSESWIDAFQTQCPAARKEARRFVIHMLTRVDRYPKETAMSRADDLVQQAIVDVLAGDLRWDPKEPLSDFLIGVCRLRARRDRRHRLRYQHRSIEDADPDDAASALTLAEAALHTAAIDEAEAARQARMDAALDQLRALTADDPCAQRYLNAAGIAVTVTDIRRLSGLSESAYHNTRRRLARLVLSLAQGATEGAAS